MKGSGGLPVRLDAAELAEFLRWIATAPNAGELARHRRRLNSAVRLGALDDRATAMLRAAIARRERELTAAQVPTPTGRAA